MGLIELKVKSAAPAELVYEIAHHAPEFVDAMPNIRRIRMLAENKDRSYSKSEWVLEVPLPKILGEVSWIKDAHWNDTGLKCDISLNRDSRGIVKRIKGLWEFMPRHHGTDMVMSVDLTVKHFLIGESTSLMIDKLLKKNIECLMIAISEQAERRNAAIECA